ncbi:Uncharacterized protein conserved in bacteria [Flavonifractor plautii]|uniref:Uncharacterized protein conserved in bacteria n=1 Tax=Flavonifractor plautii TaxID=292800 RepID=A0A174DZK9_FLAPL|nr:Uncharacterized protein conserved in bacteria [Flavonifractor plautii]
MPSGDLHPVVEHQPAAHQILELADVTRPGVPLKVLHGLVGEAEPPALLGAEAVDEQGNVLRPGPQGRQVEFDGGQAVVEIRPESPPLAHGQQVLVGRGDDPRTQGDDLTTAHPLKLPGLQHPQQLGLHLQIHVPDLVQQDIPVPRQLKLAHPGLGGAGESPLLVAEEFGFQELLWDGGTVDGHIGEGAAPVALGMDAAGDDLLAGAGLPQNEYALTAVSGLPGLVQQVGHPGALPYKILQAVAAVHPGQILVEAPEAGGLVAELGEHLFQPAQVAHRDGAHHADDPLPVQDGKQAGDTGSAMELQKEIGPGLAGAQHLLEGGELVQH